MNDKERYTQKVIKRLIKNSQDICLEFEILCSLSFHNRENTEQFNDHIKDLSDFLNQEAVIINNQSLDNLELIYKNIIKYDDNTDAFNRISIIIDDKIKEIYDTYGYNQEDIQVDDYQVDIVKENDDNDFDVSKIFDDYFTDEEINEKEANKVIDNIAIYVLKNMDKRINETIADNKNDIKYKRRLINQLKVFKYFVFTLDLRLEKYGVKYKFNVNNIPMPTINNVDTDLSRNQTINCIEKLYNVKNNENRPSEINEALFNMMLLEIYIRYLDEEDIDKLREMCSNVNEHILDSFYGNLAFSKLIKRRK